MGSTSKSGLHIPDGLPFEHLDEVSFIDEGLVLFHGFLAVDVQPVTFIEVKMVELSDHQEGTPHEANLLQSGKRVEMVKRGILELSRSESNVVKARFHAIFGREATVGEIADEDERLYQFFYDMKALPSTIKATAQTVNDKAEIGKGARTCDLRRAWRFEVTDVDTTLKRCRDEMLGLGYDTLVKKTHP